MLRREPCWIAESNFWVIFVFMRNTFVSFLLFAVVILLQLQCKSPLHSDVNFCRFTVNGSTYNAGCDGPFDNCINAVLYPQYKSLTVTANSGTGAFSFSILDSTMKFNSGTYLLNTQRINCAEYDKNGSIYGYLTDSTHIGYVSVTFDKVNYRVSGTFTISAKYELDSETVNIANGSFSIKYSVD